MTLERIVREKMHKINPKAQKAGLAFAMLSLLGPPILFNHYPKKPEYQNQSIAYVEQNQEAKKPIKEILKEGGVKIKPVLEYAHLVEKYAPIVNVPLPIVLAILHVENYLGKSSPKGAKGPGQLIDGWTHALGTYRFNKIANSFGVVKNVHNDEANILATVIYAKDLWDSFGGDPALTLAAYNAGPNRVKKNGRIIPSFTETQDYVRNGMKAFRYYETLFGK